jgi:hypothetical protein
LRARRGVVLARLSRSVPPLEGSSAPLALPTRRATRRNIKSHTVYLTMNGPAEPQMRAVFSRGECVTHCEALSWEATQNSQERCLSDLAINAIGLQYIKKPNDTESQRGRND